MAARPMSARRSSLATPVDIIFKNADQDGDGMLNPSEFKAVLSMLHAALPADEAAELSAFLAEVGQLPDEDVAEIFREVNRSKSGLISLDEFRTCEFFEEDD